MTRKRAIKHFKRNGMLIQEEAVNQAIVDMEKLDKIERIIDDYNNGDEMEYTYLARIREVLESEEVNESTKI